MIGVCHLCSRDVSLTCMKYNDQQFDRDMGDGRMSTQLGRARSLGSS